LLAVSARYSRIHFLHSGHRDGASFFDGEHWRTSVCVNNSQFFVISRGRKVKTGQSLNKKSKPTALHTEGTAQVSEWLNISDTAEKLY